MLRNDQVTHAVVGDIINMKYLLPSSKASHFATTLLFLCTCSCGFEMGFLGRGSWGLSVNGWGFRFWGFELFWWWRSESCKVAVPTTNLQYSISSTAFIQPNAKIQVLLILFAIRVV